MDDRTVQKEMRQDRRALRKAFLDAQRAVAEASKSLCNCCSAVQDPGTH